MKICYETQAFTLPETRAVIEQAEAICEDYSRQGYSLTLRQLYYQFIARDLFPASRANGTGGTKNTERNYKWLGDLVSKARIGGLIDWSHLTDRTRGHDGGDAGWPDPQSAIESVTSWYGITHWDGQPEYLEVWIEKEALADVISRPASQYDVAHMATKGYLSQSEMHTAAKRLRGIESKGRKCTILYLGDHDPSGLDMTEDIRRRMELFRCGAEVERLALNMDQVEELNPPPSPAKITDSRAADYIERYGDDSWELDALDPATLEGLVRDAITSRIDMGKRQARLDREERERTEIAAVSDNWDEVRRFMITEGLLVLDAEGEDED